MEATAKYNFEATNNEELSFRKGDLLKILETTDDWYRAELNGYDGFVPRNYISIDLPSWYQEDTSRSEAQSQLIGKQVGSFLIRGSQSTPGEFSISVRHHQDVQHFKVIRDSNGTYYLWSEKFFSVNQLVDYYKRNSVSRETKILLVDAGQEQAGRRGELPPLPPSNRSADHRAPQQTRSRTDLPYESASNRPAVSNASPNHGTRGTLPPLPPSQRNSDSMPARQSVTSSRLLLKALYSFSAEEEDELTFDAGEIIEVLEQPDQFWWKGKVRGRTGLFPTNYTVPA